MPKGKPAEGKRRIISANEYKKAIAVLAERLVHYAPRDYIHAYVQATKGDLAQQTGTVKLVRCAIADAYELILDAQQAARDVMS